MSLLAAFFLFGACMSGLAALTLFFPGTPVDRVWVINPQGHAGLAALRWPAATGMALLCAIMAATAFGRFGRRRWAWWSAAAVLTVNGLCDLTAAMVPRDPRSIVGVPVAGLILWWMIRWRTNRRRPS